MTPVIEVKNLKKYFSVPNGELHAVDDVSFKIEARWAAPLSICWKTHPDRFF